MVQQNINKIKKMKSRNYVYDYEMTRKRKVLKRLEQVVNYGIAITFATVIFGGVIIVFISTV